MAFCDRCGGLCSDVGGDRGLLAKIAAQLYAWAKQSQDGGWSTHQVGPQRTLADGIARYLVQTAGKGGPR